MSGFSASYECPNAKIYHCVQPCDRLGDSNYIWDCVYSVYHHQEVVVRRLSPWWCLFIVWLLTGFLLPVAYFLLLVMADKMARKMYWLFLVFVKIYFADHNMLSWWKNLPIFIIATLGLPLAISLEACPEPKPLIKKINYIFIQYKNRFYCD